MAISSGVTGMSNFAGSVSTPLSAALTTILSALGAAVDVVADEDAAAAALGDALLAGAAAAALVELTPRRARRADAVAREATR